jgi:hypothetical protein
MGLAVDVAVTSPFSIVGLRSSEPCEAYALKRHTKNDAANVDVEFVFATLVLETTGGINKEGADFLKQLFRFAARQ